MYKRTNEDGSIGYGFSKPANNKFAMDNIQEVSAEEILELYKKGGYDASDELKKYLSINTKK